jgi:hypothetical protein
MSGVLDHGQFCVKITINMYCITAYLFGARRWAAKIETSFDLFFMEEVRYDLFFDITKKVG